MNKLLKISLAICLSILFIPDYSFASCPEKLPRTLKQGMKGSDVKILQQFLNDFPEFQIATSGVNSKGKENGVFDLATLKSFKKFQTVNYDLILKPAGLKVANGVVGTNSRSIINNSFCDDIVPDITTSDKTSSPVLDSNSSEASVLAQFDKDLALMKAKLNQINSKMGDTSGTSLSDAKNNLTGIQSKLNQYTSKYSTMDTLAKRISDSINKSVLTSGASKDIIIEAILPASPKTGSDIYLFATNLSMSNKVYIGSTAVVAKLTNPSDKFLVLKIPASINPGYYDIYIENTYGKSESYNIQIIKGSSDSAANVQTPSIISISPTSGNVGTLVTITGERFTKKNIIHTTSKSYYDVVSTDGKTLKFTVEADGSLLGNSTKLMSQLPFTFFVRNENGDSNVVNLKLE